MIKRQLLILVYKYMHIQIIFISDVSINGVNIIFVYCMDPQISYYITLYTFILILCISIYLFILTYTLPAHKQ